MEPIAYWLPVVWAALLGVGVVMYVLLDGFDLGIGILFLTGADEQERDAMMNSDRAVLGWQRNVARARGRGSARRISHGLRHHHAGPLSSNHRHASRAGLPGRGVRVPFRVEAAASLVGLVLRARLHDCNLLPGCGAGRLRARHQRQGRTVCGRELRMASSLSRSSAALA